MFTLFKSPLCINVFLHIEQAIDFSSMWVLSCIFNYYSLWIPCHIWSRQMASLLSPYFKSQLVLNAFVYLQKATFCKCLVTWLLSLVNPLVYGQFTTIPECLVTFGASKWLLSRTCPFMYLQTALSCVSSIHHYPWMPCHIWSRQMDFPLWGSFHDSSNLHLS